MNEIQIYADGKLLELGNNFAGVRLNNKVFNPTELRGKQAEYSFTFNVPATKENSIAFGFANIPAQPGKFRRRYSAQVYASGTLIFDGSLVLKSYKDGQYSCNLVSVKLWSNEDIFGEAVLADIPWEVDFSGAPTINSVNADTTKKYAFPLICYGAFSKQPYDQDDVGGYYTPKGTIDKWNQFWYESFYPSLNVLETVRKAYEWKGFQVGGTAFQDPVLSNIYASCKLSSEQIPIYNLGNEKLGRLRLSGSTQTSSSTYITQDLSFPYYKVMGWDKVPGTSSTYMLQANTQYNFNAVNIWNILDNNTVMQGQSYLFDPKTGDRDGENVIVIPADGFYKIYLTVQGDCMQTENFRAPQWKLTDDGMQEVNMTITPNVKESTPIEIQLVRNYDGNLELIKGCQNVKFMNGDPSVQTYNTKENKVKWFTCFPHQQLYGAEAPTVTSSITDADTTSNARRGVGSTVDITGSDVSESTNTGRGNGGRRGSTGRENERTSATSRQVLPSTTTIGYVNQPGSLMPYDPVVSPIFICGLSSMNDGTAAVIRDGYSWSKGNSDKNESFSDQPGLRLMTYNSQTQTTSTTKTEYCRDEYPDAPSSYLTCSSFNGRFVGRVACCVWLNRNDVLELMAVQRDYHGSRYKCRINWTLDIQAMSERHKDALKSGVPSSGGRRRAPGINPYVFGFNSQSEFPEKLNLGNFMSDETKVSDWIDNVVKAFNITTTQDGNLIQLDKTTSTRPLAFSAVELDGKCDAKDAELSVIDYPSEMSVQWTINKDEWGFELTIPQEYINDYDWYDHGDSGYTVIKLNDDTYSTSTLNETVPFSYTWYQDFSFEEYDQQGVVSGVSHILTPVIELSQYMSEGYNYEKAMEHDGYSLSQRFFFRPTGTTKSVQLFDHMHETVNLYVPEKVYGEVNISYKDSEKSLLTEFFNMAPMLDSNYAKIEVYLTPDEYIQLRGGALAHFDSDLYYTCQISGFDASGRNPTTLTLMKKT